MTDEPLCQNCLQNETECITEIYLNSKRCCTACEHVRLEPDLRVT